MTVTVTRAYARNNIYKMMNYQTLLKRNDDELINIYNYHNLQIIVIYNQTEIAPRLTKQFLSN